jgi:hypothetical protein
MAKFNDGTLIQAPELLPLLETFGAKLGVTLDFDAAYTRCVIGKYVYYHRVEHTCARKWRQ